VILDKNDSSELNTLWDEARNHIQSGRLDKAIEIYKYILLRYPDENVATEYANAYLGDLYLSLQQLDPAEKHIRKAISSHPDKAPYHYILGFVFSSRKNWDLAIFEFKKALAEEPQNAEYTRGLGWATYQKGNRGNGIAILIQADKLSPGNVRILTDLAVAYMPVDLAQAKKHAELAIKACPDDSLARQVFDQIKVFEQDFVPLDSKPPLVYEDESSNYSDAEYVFQFKVSPNGNPDIWRIIEIKGNQLLSSLHKGIALGFDLQEKKTYSFFFHEKHRDIQYEFASAVPGISGTPRTSKNIRIDSIGLFQDEKDKFRYLFDYEKMSWYEVELVQVKLKNTRAKYPRVIKKLSNYPKKRRKNI
jgi:tetratricopeptide (TPR) repeat protein